MSKTCTAAAVDELGADGGGQARARLVDEANKFQTSREASYTVTVAPGVDLACIAAVCICLNQVRKTASMSLLSEATWVL
ncbi:hypothetical protein Q8F55_008473 [Vanrija albida]|uniref:Uncharacterized protein n=1 Tax=Vanrija albida TaxID=181172 RepID=A0ABR3PQY1_9TREE